MFHEYFLTTCRRRIHIGRSEDADFHSLWTNPNVMRFVGSPQGLAASVAEVREGLESDSESEFGSALISKLLETKAPIDQGKIGRPDAEGLCEPNIMLKPAF